MLAAGFLQAVVGVMGWVGVSGFTGLGGALVKQPPTGSIKINQMYNIDVGNYTSFIDSMGLVVVFGRGDPRIRFEDAKEINCNQDRKKNDRLLGIEPFW